MINRIPKAMEANLCTLPPPYEGFFQVNPITKAITPIKINRNLYVASLLIIYWEWVQFLNQVF